MFYMPEMPYVLHYGHPFSSYVSGWNYKTSTTNGSKITMNTKGQFFLTQVLLVPPWSQLSIRPAVSELHVILRQFH